MKRLRPPCGTRSGLALALVLACGTARAGQATVYRWIDASGVSHYTAQRDRIPSEFRSTVQEIGGPAGTTAPAGSDDVVRSTPATDVIRSTPAPEAGGAVATPPAVAAPPPAGPRVMPQGDFEEPPLGHRGSTRSPEPSAAAPAAAPTAVPSRPAAAPVSASAPTADPVRTPDVAAPPPGFVRGTAAASPAPAPLRAAAPEPQAEPGPIDPAALDDRIHALEEQVGRDQTALQDILSQPRATDGPRIADRPDFREIAQRLPELQANLKALRQQRTRQGL